MLKPGIRGRDNLIEEVSSSVSLFLIGVHDRISQDLYILMPGLTGRHMNRATSGITGRIAVGLPQGFDQLVVILDIMVRCRLAMIIVQSRRPEATFLGHSPVGIRAFSHRFFTVVEGIRRLNVAPAHLRHIRGKDVIELLPSIRGNPRLGLIESSEDAALTDRKSTR